MALLELQLNSSTGNYRFRTRLDDVDYVFRFRWSGREESWIMDIRDFQNNPVVAGVRVVTNIDLLANFKHLDIPQGDLVAINLKSDTAEPGRNNFGTDIRIIYAEART